MGNQLTCILRTKREPLKNRLRVHVPEGLMVKFGLFWILQRDLPVDAATSVDAHSHLQFLIKKTLRKANEI